MDALGVLNQAHRQAAQMPENKGKPVNQWKMPEIPPEHQEIIDRGMSAGLPKAEPSTLPVGTEPAVHAGHQAASGDLAGAGGTLAGAYAAGPILGKAVSKISGMLPKQQMAERLYGSALKPPPSMPHAERQAIIQTGLREGIKLGPDVVDEVQGRIHAINKKIATEIEARSNAGATADPRVVAGYTDRSKARFTNQVNPDADLAAIGGAKEEFLRSQSVEAPYTKVRPGFEEAEGTLVPEGHGVTMVPTDIPLAKAQQIKQGTYAKLKDSYGEQASAAREAQKDMARGLKDEIVKAFPEISGLNQKESAYLALEASLERFVGREGNKHLIGIGTPIAAGAIHAMGAPVVPLTLLKSALEMPEIKSRIAIALARSAKNPQEWSAGVGTVLPASGGTQSSSIRLIFPSAKVGEFATKNGISEQEARQRLQSQGWTIQ